MNDTFARDRVKPRESAGIRATKIDRILLLIGLVVLFACLSPEIPASATLELKPVAEPILSPLTTQLSFDRFEMQAEAEAGVDWVKAEDLDIAAEGDSTQIFENDGYLRGWTHARGIGDALLRPTKWWNCGWSFRVAVDVGVGAYERYDKPVEVALNFTDLLTGLGEIGALDEDSIRMIEVDAQGDVLDAGVPFQFDKGAEYDAASNASGTLVFLLGGTTAPNTTRRFHVYFDVTGSSFSPPSFPARVSLTDGVMHEDQESYKIITQNATYYYHKVGAGFASMEDIDGEDWIGYHPGGGSAGEYRGIPNMNDFAHPGDVSEALRGESMVVNQGPLKITIFSERWDQEAATTWEMYPEYAKMTVNQMPSTYLWGYEGTPGGTLELDDYYLMSDGLQRSLSENWSAGDMAGPEWVYFGDQVKSRKLFLIHHEDDDKSDQYWTMNGEMTVWGFGRTYPCCNPSMDIFPGHFTIGFADETTFEATSKIIDSSYQDLAITQGAAEFNDCVSLPHWAFLPMVSR